MSYTTEQIELMDKVLDYFKEFYINHSTKYDPSASFLGKQLGTDKDNIQFAINNVCKHGHEIEFLTAEKFGYGDYKVYKMNKLLTDNFINEGGFKTYFAKNDKENNGTIQNIHVGDNYGQINQFGHNATFSDNNDSKLTDSSSNKKNQHKSFIVRILKSSWTITIIGGLIVLIIGAYFLHRLGLK
jgi:hypothetical protein